MLGSPPWPQPLAASKVASAVAVRRVVQSVVRRGRARRGVFQKSQRAGVRRQRMALPNSPGLVAAGLFRERLTEATVWMVATAFWGAPLRVMFEGRSEQEA
jgi:hypothetical protein